MNNNKHNACLAPTIASLSQYICSKCDRERGVHRLYGNNGYGVSTPVIQN